MKKIIIIAALLATVTCVAQRQDAAGFPLLRGGNTDNQIIQTMMKPAFVLIDQGYRVKDSAGAVYSGKGKECFGNVYSIGLRTRNGLFLSREAIAPWEYDPAYEEYSPYYAPVNYRTIWRPLADTTQRVQWSADTRLDTLLSGTLFCNNGDTVGIEIDEVKGTVSGYMVWVMSRDSLNLDSLTLEVVQEKITAGEAATVEINLPMVNKFKGLIDAQSAGYVVGGAFVVPDYTALGTLTLKVAGMAVKVDGKWVLATHLSSCAAKPRVKGRQVELVPVNPSRTGGDDIQAIPVNPNHKDNAKPKAHK